MFLKIRILINAPRGERMKTLKIFPITDAKLRRPTATLRRGPTEAQPHFFSPGMKNDINEKKKHVCQLGQPQNTA